MWLRVREMTGSIWWSALVDDFRTASLGPELSNCSLLETFGLRYLSPKGNCFSLPLTRTATPRGCSLQTSTAASSLDTQQRGYECVYVLVGVVKRQGRPDGTLDTHALQNRLSTVVAGTYRDSFLA